MNDLRFAFRSLVKTPGFTAVALLTLALGIGVNTSMFSVLNGFLLRPLSFPQAERLFRLSQSRPQQPPNDLAPATYNDIAQAGAEVASFAAYRYWAFTLTEPNQPADVPNALRVSTTYFDVLGRTPQLGRGFLPDEGTDGQDRVIVISHSYWQSRFQGDPHVLDRTVRLDGEPVRIVGVLPPDNDTIRVLGPVGIYRPLVWKGSERTDRTHPAVGVIGRYREGVTPEQAAARFAAIAARLATDYPAENAGLTFVARSLQSTTLQGVGLTMTWLLLGLSGLVLLIACSNLANLLLARSLGRAQEFSIRAALGASRVRLMKPLAVECAILAVLGGAGAMLVSAWTNAWLAGRFGSPAAPADFSADGRVLLFALLVSLLTALLFGVGPAWWASRVDLNSSLRAGGRGAVGSRIQHRYRQTLIVTQFALALVLLAGAGFFLRGLAQLANARAGWDPAPVVSGRLNLASGNYNSAEAIIAFHAQLRERLLALPGVANSAVGFTLPLYDSPSRKYLVAGRPVPPPGQELTAFTNAVSSSFFDTVGVRLVRGRFIDETDQLKSRPVVVINETMARTLFPEGNAVGGQLALAGQPELQWAEIVGVVEDTSAQNVAPSSVRFQVYKPFPQEAWQYVTIMVRASDPAKTGALLEPIRKTVAALDPDQPVINLLPAAERSRRDLNVWGTISGLLALFAGLGLLLAGLGIYGVVSRLVLMRSHEIGVRMALGAQLRDIVRLILGNGLRLSLIGAAAGMLGAAYFAHFLAKKLPAFGRGDLSPIAAAAALLVLVALLACWLPARRATKVDPMTALRAE